MKLTKLQGAYYLGTHKGGNLGNFAALHKWFPVNGNSAPFFQIPFLAFVGRIIPREPKCYFLVVNLFPLFFSFFPNNSPYFSTTFYLKSRTFQFSFFKGNRKRKYCEKEIFQPFWICPCRKRIYKRSVEYRLLFRVLHVERI